MNLPHRGLHTTAADYFRHQVLVIRMAYRVEAAELEPGPHLVPVSESKIAGPDLLGLLPLLLLLAARHQLLGPGAYTWGGGGGSYP